MNVHEEFRRQMFVRHLHGELETFHANTRGFLLLSWPCDQKKNLIAEMMTNVPAGDEGMDGIIELLKRVTAYLERQKLPTAGNA